MPKVSVIISTLNRPKTLPIAIKSVVDQTFQDWELIVINDGGQDVRAIVESFRDSRIHYHSFKHNRGPAARFNLGLVSSTGDFITYLGDDDLYYPNHLGALCGALEKAPANVALVYGDLYAVSFIEDETTGERIVLDKGIHLSRKFNRDFMWYFNHVLQVSAMHRRQAAIDVGGFNENVRVVVEWDLFRKLAFFYDFQYVPQVTGEYWMAVKNSDRISVQQRRNKVEYKRNLRRIKSWIPSTSRLCCDQQGNTLRAIVQPVAVHYEAHPDKRNDNEIFYDETYAFVKAFYDNADYPFVFYFYVDFLEEPSYYQNILTEFDDLPNFICVRIDDDVAGFSFEEQQQPLNLIIEKGFKANRNHHILLSAVEEIMETNSAQLHWPNGEATLHYKNGKGERTFSAKVPRSFIPDQLFQESKRLLRDKKPLEALDLLEKLKPMEKGFNQSFLGLHIVRAALTTGEKLTYNEIRSIIPYTLQRRFITMQHAFENDDLLMAEAKARTILTMLNFDANVVNKPTFPTSIGRTILLHETLLTLAKTYYEQGDLEGATKTARLCAMLKVNDSRAFKLFGKIFTKLGLHTEALDAEFRAAFRGKTNELGMEE